MLDGRFATHPALTYVRFGLEVLFLVALIVLAVVLIARALRPRRQGPQGGPMEAPPHPTAESALRILNDRFARGEVDEDTYRKMKDEIRKP